MLPILLLVVLSLSGGEKTQATEAEHRVELAPFVVYGAPEGLSWQYARYRDFEALTMCTPDLTQAVIEAAWRGRHLIPDQFEPERSDPAAVVLYDLRSFISSRVEPGTMWQKDASADLGADWVWIGGNILYPETEDDLMAANLGGIDRMYTLDSDHLPRLFKDYRPRPPEWILIGLFGPKGAYTSLGGYSLGEPQLRVPVFRWLDDAASKALRSNKHPEAEFLSFDQLFASQPPGDEAGPAVRRKWEDQAALFARWQILGHDGAKSGGKDGFWRLVYLASSGVPVDEELFKQCLGWSYAEAAQRMGRYLKGAVLGPGDIGMKPFPRTGIITLQPATEAQIARLKGNFERLEAKRLRADHPDLAALYEEAARSTLLRGLKRTDNDPAVRAVLGRLEMDTGHPAAARPHLEAAFAAKVANTRALLALARLRIDEAIAADGKIAPAQLQGVFAPLTAARERKPAEVETYRLIAEIWRRSVAPPQRGHLAVLLEGVKLFPHDLDLLRQVAEVHQQYGFGREAAVVAALGLLRSNTAERKAGFSRFLAETPGSPKP